MKYEWKDVTDTFSESRRHYKNMYLEVCEIYENAEVNLYSSMIDPYEIYFSYGRMYGIIYTNEEECEELREKVKTDIAHAYDQSEEPTSEFVEEFFEKYDAQFPSDTLFDTEKMMNALLGMFENWNK